MTALLALVPWYYRLLAVVALTVAGSVFGFVKGLDYAGNQADKADRSALQTIIKIERKQASQVASAAAAHEVKRTETRTIYKTIEKEVIRYVQASAPACRLTAGWMRLHDAAALSAVPAAPGESDAAPSSVTDLDALGVVTSNYESCNETRQQLIDLQALLREIGNSYHAK